MQTPEIEYAWALHGLPNTQGKSFSRQGGWRRGWRRGLEEGWKGGGAILWPTPSSSPSSSSFPFWVSPACPGGWRWGVGGWSESQPPSQPAGGTVTVRLFIYLFNFFFSLAESEWGGFSPHYICLSSGAFAAGRKITVFADDNAIN